ncbi:hypothetical protein POG22_13045 [Geitlerinema sp. CS-897]|nr:hypothetical protein [Geitlerinema sp. CS-897]
MQKILTVAWLSVSMAIAQYRLDRTKSGLFSSVSGCWLAEN